MHTNMYQRKAAVAPIAAVTTTTATSTTTNTAKVPQQRRRKVSSSSSSSSLLQLKLGRKDFIIAILATFVLTALIVAVILKLYFYAFLHDMTHHHQGNHPNFMNPLTFTKKQREQRDLQKFEDGNENGDDDSAIPYNEFYRIPNSMKNVGDRTDRYVQLRMEIDALLPVQQYERSLQLVHELESNNPFAHHIPGNVQPAPQQQQHDDSSSANEADGVDGIQEPKIISREVPQHNSDQVTNPTYDIYNCPDTPPEGYPYAWNMVQLLQNWKPDNTTRPSSNLIHQSICVFDYTTDYNKAMAYRKAELPFIVIHDPAVAETVERWNTPGYLPRLMGSVLHRTEYSENNHFMYFVPPPKNKHVRKSRMTKNIIPPDWKAPTKLIRMSYLEWLRHANVTDDTLLGPDHPHWYYRLIGCGMTGNDGSCDTESSEYLFDELTFFQPRPDQLYIVQPEEQKGIHCRFGMKGVIAENHFDGSRNAIVVLGGSRRYILSHPNQCEHLALYPKGHPSARHSAVDWSHPNLDEFPQFKLARGNELVLTAGQVLYLPTEWFHYIVSLELNFQCNTRSGITNHYKKYIKQCGF